MVVMQRSVVVVVQLGKVRARLLLPRRRPLATPARPGVRRGLDQGERVAPAAAARIQCHLLQRRGRLRADGSAIQLHKLPLPGLVHDEEDDSGEEEDDCHEDADDDRHEGRRGAVVVRRGGGGGGGSGGVAFPLDMVLLHGVLLLRRRRPLRGRHLDGVVASCRARVEAHLVVE